MLCYIALILKKVFDWQQKHELYRNEQIRWLFNLGFPSTDFNDANLIQIKDNFNQIAQVAWKIAQNEKIIFTDCREAFSENTTSPFVHVFPEIVAQLTGYTKSPQRQNGMHFLIDVGAGTVDIASFEIYQKEGDDKFQFLHRKVERLGTYEFLKQAIPASLQQLDRWIQENGGPLAPIPIDMLNKNNPNFIQSIFSMLNDTIKQTRQMDKLSTKWDNGIRLFLCGGGKEIKAYQDAKNKGHQFIQDKYHVQIRNNFQLTAPAAGFLDIKLPEPTDLEFENSKVDYHRLSVAYGLSFHPLNIGEDQQADPDKQPDKQPDNDFDNFLNRPFEHGMDDY